MIIPWQSIGDEVLDALLEEVVTRDGTDYGDAEKTTEQKVTFARNQLQAGYAVILWNAELESASLVGQDQAEEIEKLLEQGDSETHADSRTSPDPVTDSRTR